MALVNTLHPLPVFSHALLSYFFNHHRVDFRQTGPPPIKKTDHHPHMLQQTRQPVAPLPPDSRHTPSLFSLPIAPIPLIPFTTPLPATIILGSPVIGLPSTMRLPATKTTPKILSSGIARIRQKIDPAMPASNQALAQPRLVPQPRSQKLVVLPDQPPDFPIPIPPRPKLKILPDLD